MEKKTSKKKHKSQDTISRENVKETEEIRVGEEAAEETRSDEVVAAQEMKSREEVTTEQVKSEEDAKSEGEVTTEQVKSEEDAKSEEEVTTEDTKSEKEVPIEETKSEEETTNILIDYGAVEKKSRKKPILIGLLCLLVILAGVYVYLAYHYEKVIFNGTSINGIDCSGLTVSQAEAELKEKIEDYTLEIAFRDGTSNIIEGSDIAYEYVPGGEIQQILDNQQNWNWISYIFSEREYNVPEPIQFDEELLRSAFTELDSLSVDKAREPADAYITYDNYSFVIVPEDEGNSIRQVYLYDEVMSAVSNSKTEINVEELDLYRKPEIRSDNKELIEACEQLNAIAAVSITYVLPEGEKVLDGNVVRQWLTVDEKNQYTISQDELKEKVTEFVKEMSEEVNTVGSKRNFHATIQGDIEVSGGSYGYKINQKEEVNRILENIENHSVTIREPAYTSKEVTTEADGLGDTYIEIDLSNQHLWYYIDGELYEESDIVSGTYTVSSRKTPPGIFLLTYKARNRVLRGQKKEDGTYEYESPVSYWMPFNRGIGLHDATWRGSFGGNIFKYSGSHGCINLPLKKAKAIYAKIDEKTPIICYY